MPPVTIITETFVPGRPKTKGSLDFVTRQHARESVAGSKRWRMMVADAVQRDMQQRGRTPLFGAAVGVRLCFFLAAPRDFGAAPDRAPVWPRSGDIDKLTRNALDALTDAKAYQDDVQVAHLIANKVCCVGEQVPGMMIQVWELAPAQIRSLRAEPVWTGARNAALRLIEGGRVDANR